MSIKHKQVYDEVDLNVVLNFFEKKRLAGLGVIGAGIGHRIQSDELTDEVCIRVYVRKKLPSEQITKKVPRFVYGRKSDGSIIYSKKIKTDVIPMEDSGLCCKSGVEIEPFGHRGALTLVFKNKVPRDNTIYILTCSHVVGDLTRSPPIHETISSSCCQQDAKNFAVTRANTISINNTIEYDIALAEITSSCTPQSELDVEGSGKKIERFFPPDNIQLKMQLSCAFPASRIRSAKIVGLRTFLSFTVNGRVIRFNNLFAIDRRPLEGDSGGLLYIDSDAVGMIVAFRGSEGFFQPLEEAFSHLQTLANVPLISCF